MKNSVRIITVTTEMSHYVAIMARKRRRQKCKQKQTVADRSVI